MRLASRFSILVVLATLAFGVSVSAAASKPQPQPPVPIGANPTFQSVRIGPTSALATCSLGATAPAAYIYDYILPPDDAYYTLITPASCAACNTGAVTVLTAHVLLNFRATCALPIYAGIYAATGDVACYVPDPNTPLCTPVAGTVTPGAAGNYNISITLPAGCCITGPAFLKIEFPSFPAGCSTPSTWPRLITTADCTLPCNSWNIYPSGGPDDLCYDIGFPGQPSMYVDVNCCDPTPTLKHSWGSLKSAYH